MLVLCWGMGFLAQLVQSKVKSHPGTKQTTQDRGWQMGKETIKAIGHFQTYVDARVLLTFIGNRI